MSDERYDLWRDDAIAEAKDSAVALERDSKRTKKAEEDSDQVQERRNCSER